jgi:hypothetical protein
MAKTKEPKVKKTKEKVLGSRRGMYSLEVSVNDVEYKGSANSVHQALSDFVLSPSFPFGVKTRVMLKFSDGKKEGSQRYGALVARRVFKAISHKPSALEVLASKLEERMY